MPSKFSDKTCVDLFNYVYRNGPAPDLLYEEYATDLEKVPNTDPEAWFADNIVRIMNDFRDDIEHGAQVLTDAGFFDDDESEWNE